MAVARRGKTGEVKASNVPTMDLPDEKYGKKSSLFRPIGLLVCTTLLIFGISKTATVGLSSSSVSALSKSSSKSDGNNDNNIESLRRSATQQFENCTISYQPPPPRTNEKEWRKPLWVPAMPASGAASPSNKGDLMKALIDSVTGLNKGTKNYHMSMRNRLRRCRGISETAACTQGHPYVSIGPEGQTNNFQSPVVLALRNPRDAFPGGHTDKNIAYHKAQGQPSERQWRQVRDEYYQGAVKTWKEMIEWWTTNDYYKVALFVPYEQLLHPTTGPPLVQRLAAVFQQAGFEVAPPTDIPCLWYKAVQPEWKRQEILLSDYIPGFRAAQREYYMTFLQDFLKEIEEKQNPQQQGDLVQVLQGYYNDIRDNTRIDEAALEEEPKE